MYCFFLRLFFFLFFADLLVISADTDELKYYWERKQGARAQHERREAVHVSSEAFPQDQNGAILFQLGIRSPKSAKILPEKERNDLE